MLASAWFRFGTLLAAAGVFTVTTLPAMGREPRAYGQQLVAQYRLPPHAIARYAALAAGTALDAPAREHSRLADRSPWVGPQQRAGVGHNPYTLVLSISGVTKAAGDVYAHWQAGWEVQESPVASRELLMAMPRMSRTGVTAGQALTLTVNSARVSFRGERRVAPILGVVQTRNLDIQDVQLQVWSGAAPVEWAVPPWTGAALLTVGLALLLVGWGSKCMQHAVAAAPELQPARCEAVPCNETVPPEAVGSVEVVAAPVAPPRPAPCHGAQVLAVLNQVLTAGLTVHTVLDESRQRRPRAAR
jgi:hypothetical protein